MEATKLSVYDQYMYLYSKTGLGICTIEVKRWETDILTHGSYALLLGLGPISHNIPDISKRTANRNLLAT